MKRRKSEPSYTLVPTVYTPTVRPDLMPDTLPAGPWQNRQLRIRESIGGAFQAGRFFPGESHIVCLNLRSSIARRWIRGELVNLTPAAIVASAWYSDRGYDGSRTKMAAAPITYHREYHD